MPNIKTLKFSHHARMRGCQRMLGITNPTHDQRMRCEQLISKMAIWSEIHGKFILEEYNLYLVIRENTIVTVRPRTGQKRKTYEVKKDA